MMDANSIGRLTALSPVTWTDGWPYFGLPGNLGRSPRTWVKPNTGATEKPHAPYLRNDDFSGPRLQPVWQWNHIPVEGKWSLAERPGYLRLHALQAADLWRAHNTLTQRATGPSSTVTTILETAGMKPGDTAGLALFNKPYAWLGVERSAEGASLTKFDEITSETTRVPLSQARVWLRAECDFNTNIANFSYSTDGRKFTGIGKPHTMAYGLTTFQGVRYSLFSYNTQSGGEAGYADFDSLTVTEPPAKRIPYNQQIELSVKGGDARIQLKTASVFTVIDRGLGRIALKTRDGFVSVDPQGGVTLRSGAPAQGETFQWMETFNGDLILMSLATNRYLRVNPEGGEVLADSPGPRPDGKDGVRLQWKTR